MTNKKTIELSCTVKGASREGFSKIPIKEQMKKILDDNKNYRFVSLIYYHDKFRDVENARLYVKYDQK